MEVTYKCRLLVFPFLLWLSLLTCCGRASVTATSINCLHLVNDSVLLASSQQGLQCARDRFVAAYDQGGMKISTKKAR